MVSLGAISPLALVAWHMFCASVFSAVGYAMGYIAYPFVLEEPPLPAPKALRDWGDEDEIAKKASKIADPAERRGLVEGDGGKEEGQGNGHSIHGKIVEVDLSDLSPASKNRAGTGSAKFSRLATAPDTVGKPATEHGGRIAPKPSKSPADSNEEPVPRGEKPDASMFGLLKFHFGAFGGISLLFFFSLFGSNLAYLFTPVALLQVVKACTPAFPALSTFKIHSASRFAFNNKRSSLWT